jgi:hypothetical protein
MSRDVVKGEQNSKKHITFETLVTDTEARIEEYQGKIKALRKSLVFFKKQESSGVPFPVLGGYRHKKIS